MGQAAKHPPISVGAVVMTTTENLAVRDEWNAQAHRENCRWGVEGVVGNYHDAHGLCYEVLLGEALIATFDPAELQDTGRVADEQWYIKMGIPTDFDTMA